MHESMMASEIGIRIGLKIKRTARTQANVKRIDTDWELNEFDSDSIS